MITRRTVVFLGLSQLVCWGVSFYLIGVFGDRIAADLGWSHTVVFGGYSMALLTMGLVSPIVGRMIDRFGGGHVMAAGSVLCAAGCATLASATAVTAYYAAWLCLGVAMRAILYDAAFATLARIDGAAARRPIAQITLLGGLASTCFWPIGHLLADALGWRGALAVYAVIALLTVPLHLAMPQNRHDPDPAAPSSASAPAAAARPGNTIGAAWLYALIVALTNGLNSGMSAHMIGLLADLGIAAGLAVTVSALRGVGQSAARLAEVLFGGRLSPAQLNLAAAFVLPASFAVGLASGVSLSAAVAFALCYGAGNGILTITRGTLPLVLFDITTYGAFVGKLLVPAFLFSAAPLRRGHRAYRRTWRAPSRPHLRRGDPPGVVAALETRACVERSGLLRNAGMIPSGHRVSLPRGPVKCPGDHSCLARGARADANRIACGACADWSGVFST